ncbi:helix-hairpin-helix domain-containing protein [Thiomicrorhabdus sp. zzn3]|uniref:helix-hairpin-helix domain-containing protein n=1 Tax=Thiomicrorhabdus sp. zzn3 TaxID=3039775 RepID=UPI00243672E8|nr:helix-hairpin-helix domain-containing protein [Thiomicrorhabdus sp. zzn3]MDG6778140.1 helix-hairpin-helix domain-containing protein [Thiomicrorhabdus sp. zzn3]
MNLRNMLLIASLLVTSPLAYANPVNVNTASPQEIAHSLDGVNPNLAREISLHCGATNCKQPKDLLHVYGMSPDLLHHIKGDLRFHDMKPEKDSNDDC